MHHQLWLVTMPIGNDLDITQHALKILTEAQEIWCEDTRTFRQIATRLGVVLSGKKIISFHDHSGESRDRQFLESISEHNIAYVSEAGSPYISDPAHNLVQLCHKHEITVKTASGISSVIAALELSGLPALPFSFHGFISRQDKAQRDFLEVCTSQGGTHLIFEGVSRVLKTLDTFVENLPEETNFVVLREMTKHYESVYRFTSNNWTQVRAEIIEKGEFVIAFHIPGSQQAQSINSDILKLVDQIKNKGAKPKLVSKLISELTGEDVGEIYKLLARS